LSPDHTSCDERDAVRQRLEEIEIARRRVFDMDDRAGADS
jgi:hypothetical protein